MISYFDIIHKHAIDALRELPSDFVHCVVTSPPYWTAKRDYDLEPVIWGDGHPAVLGDEKGFWAYVMHIVEICKEIKRVLRNDGLFWLNIGDAYAKKNDFFVKKGDLIGIPWLIAFELRKMGFYLCSENIWEKNSIPEGTKKRCIRNHEYVFQFSKSPDFYFDQIAIREKASDPTSRGRHKRSVWKMSVGRLKYEHFSAFPLELVSTCLKSSTSPEGTCPKCGKQLKRDVTTERIPTRPGRNAKEDKHKKSNRDPRRHVTIYETKGWSKSCSHRFKKTGRAVVLDPFSGAGTTGVVAVRHNTDFIGIELNKKYVKDSIDRIIGKDTLWVKRVKNFWKTKGK